MSSQVLQCYTIGHSTHDVGTFVGLLRNHGIQCVVDVRSAPYSRHNPQYNKERLKVQLSASGISYVFMGDLLGARYDDPQLCFPDQWIVSYRKVRATDGFNRGIARVIDGVKKGYLIALMCAEKDPLNCHRFVLVSYSLVRHGIRVDHVLADSSKISNDSLEERLLARCKLGHRQTTLFEASRSRDEAIEEAYEKRNKEIACSIKPVATLREQAL